jgi:predicted N-acetyltransferase YhbS
MIQIMRIDAGFDRWPQLLDLIRSAFAYMDGIIDPPSSAHLLTVENLRAKALSEIAFVAIEDATLLGCIFCKPETTGTLYVGKLAVSLEAQGKGIGFQLLSKAEEVASEMAMKSLRLETRIELVGNHAKFSAWGFVKTAENAHPGFDRSTSIEMTKLLP